MKKFLLFMFWIAATNVFSQSFSSAEYFFDTDPGFGNGTPLTGVPSGSSVNFNKNIVIPSSLSPGVHTLYVRARNSGGGILKNRWSIAKPVQLLVFNPTSGTSNTDGIDRIEYFWDTDLGFGNNSVQTVNPSSVGNLALTITTPAAIQPGFHLLYVRSRNRRGIWSTAKQVPFIIWSSTINLSALRINALEYYFNSDPGYGNGTAIAFSPNPSTDVAVNLQVDMLNIPLGDNFLHVRARNENGKWSAPSSTLINVSCANGVKLYSSASGNWNMATTWACGRIPTATDNVVIKSTHKVFVPNGQAGKAKGINTEAGAVLEFSTGSVVEVKN